MENRNKQIINLKIKHNEKKIKELEDTEENHELIEKYNANIEYYERLKNEL